MDHEALRHFEPFAELDQTQLRTLARHARWLELPAQRWLLRPGRRLTGSYYLARGRVRCWPDGQLLSHRSPAARRSLYPGFEALYTWSPSQLLQVDLQPIGFLLDRGEHGLPAELPSEPWLRSWLESPLLQRIERIRWQQLLRRLEPLPVKPGKTNTTG